MSDLINIHEGILTVSSKQVAEHFNIKGGHRYVMSQIGILMGKEPEFGALNYLHSSYKSKQNKELRCYEMTGDGFTLLAMGFTGDEALKWKINYLTAFNQMESILRQDHEYMSTMERANHLTAKIESDKQSASFHGKELQSYAKTKKQNTEAVLKPIADSQHLLGL